MEFQNQSRALNPHLEALKTLKLQFWGQAPRLYTQCRGPLRFKMLSVQFIGMRAAALLSVPRPLSLTGPKISIFQHTIFSKTKAIFTQFNSDFQHEFKAFIGIY